MREEKAQYVKTEILELIDQYNALLEELINTKDMDQEEFNIKVEQLFDKIENRYLFKIGRLKSEKPLNVIVVKYYGHLEKKLQIVFPEYMQKNPYIFINKPNKYHDQKLYFNAEEFEESDIKKSRLETFGWSKTEGWYEIQKFLSSNSFYPISIEDPKIDEISIEQARLIKGPYLIFGKYLRLEDLITTLKEEISKLVKSINETENSFLKLKISNKSFENLTEISKSMNKLISLLEAKYSNDQLKDLSKINSYLNKFKHKVKQIKTYASKLQKLSESLRIKQKYDESDDIYRASIFNFKHNIPFPTTEKLKINKSIFSSFDSDDFLSSPFLSLEDDSITCCLESIDCQIGPIIPSLYSGNISLNFISFIDHPITIEVHPKDSKFDTWFYSTTYQPKDIAKIYITLINSTSDKAEMYDIEADIIISSPGLKSLTLPSNFHIIIAPQEILFTCDKYNISYNNDDNNIYLCTNKLLSDSCLNFSIQNFNIKEQLNYRIQFENLKDNAAPKPDKNNNYYKENNLKISIPHVEKPTRINCAINFKFSEKLTTKLIIDSVIVPFDFSFYLYDYNNKKYVDDSSKIYYSDKFKNREIVLHCKIASPLFEIFKNDKSISFKGLVKMVIPSEVKIVKNTIGESFTIDKETCFDIILKITSKIYYCRNKYISLSINGIEKRINLYFDEPESILNKKGDANYSMHPYLCGLRNDKKYEIISYYSNANNYIAFCSPFSFKLRQQPYIKFIEGDCYIFKANKNLFVNIFWKGKFTVIENSFKSEYKFDMINPLLPFIGIIENQWYPLYDKYSDKIKKWKILEVNKDNIKTAKRAINDFPYYAPKNNFIKLAKMINNMSVLETLREIIIDPRFSCFKEDLGCSDQILAYITEFETCDKDVEVIICYNIIKLLHKAFQKKYNEYKKNDFYLNPPISNEELDNISDILYSEYTKFDKVYVSSRSSEKLLNKVSEIECRELPSIGDQKEAYLLGINPIEVKRDVKPKYITGMTKSMKSISSKSIKVNLPEIELPSLSKPDDLSILSMDNFYQTCLKGTRILPIFVKNISSCKTEKNINDAFEYFVLLYRSFKNLEPIDRSIISQSVNTFRDSFCSMVAKFIKAGMKFSEYIPKKYIPDTETNQDFILYPNKNPIYLPPDSWNDEMLSKNDSFLFTRMSTSYEKIHVGEMMENQFDDDQQLDSLSNILSSKAAQNVDLQTNIDKAKPKNVEVSKVIEDGRRGQKDPGEKEPKDDENEEEEENLTIDVDEEEEASEGGIHVTLDKESVEISNENLDGLVSNFSESDSIKASIRRMKKENELSEIVIKDCEIPNINPLYLNSPTENINDLPIQSLIKYSLSLSQQLIIAISNQEVPFSSLCSNILVDCSCFISIENKMFNLLLICALTNALNVLAIPYSVAVFGDSNFKSIIKPFEEKHSPFVLQKIADCLFIKRFCSSLPAAIKFAIDKMEHNTRKQRAIFSFTNGLDEKIRLTKSWAESIFKEEVLSFLFVFIRSSELDISDSEYLQSVWTDFEVKTKKYGAKSIIKVTPINAQLTSFNNFVDSFIEVMKRTNEDENKNPFATPIFNVSEQLQNPDEFLQLVGTKNKNIFSENNSVFFDTTDIFKNMTSKINRLDPSIYRNKLNKIIQPLSDKKRDNVVLLVKNFIESRTKINQSTLETIFRPNKASQTVLSNTGSDIDITALILNIINPVPDPLIYLEEKGGLIRNYGVSVIIDPSISCLFNLSEAHTLLTIKSILSSFAALDIPCFDLIFSGNPQPIVLCSEVGTLYALNQKSSIWESLFSLLERPIQKSDLASAINTAYDIKRMRSKDYSSFLFVITDGLYEKSERNRILQVVNNCVQSGTAVFGIGIGSYPKGIEELFPQVVFSPNPSLVMKCVASLFGDSISGRKEKMPPIYPMDVHLDDIKESFKTLKNNEDNPIFKMLKDELSKIKHLQDAFRHYSNQEGDIGNSTKGFTNFDGEDAEMYSANTFLSQKILIVMLWDYTLNPSKENPALQTKYVYENTDSKRKECIKTAVEHFGITVEVVRNYKDAIESLTRQTKVGFCDYYAVWVMCGPPMGILPDKSKYFNLVGQFIDVLTQFWKNGGAIVFWAEGYPLYYQLNLFLDKNEFKFNVEGNHKGYKDLTPDESNELARQQTFNRHPQGDETIERSSLAHNLGVIFEGVTISYAKYDLEKIKPFIPFSRDSEGGISSMFLPGDKKKGTGDIVIDCGYTKCFANLTENGTYRYIQNIAGWTMNMEGRIASGFNPKKWRPKAVTHTIDLNAEWKFPVVHGAASNEIDIIFCSDATGSMGSWLNAAKNRSKSIADASCSKYPDKSFRFGAIFYRDPIDSPSDTNDYFQPTNNISSLVSFMNPQQPDGGGDGPEDWVGAYRILLNSISWRPGASRALIHIADAPAHGSDWGGSGSHENQNSLLHPLIHQCAKSNIFISAINVGSGATPSFNKIQQIYNEEGKSKLFKISSIDSVGSDEAGNFLTNVTADLLSQISAFDSSMPFST